jgi:transposase
MAYSKDYIERAVGYKDEGRTFAQLREAFGIPAATYYDWKEKLESGFTFGVKAKKERSRKIDSEQLRRAV